VKDESQEAKGFGLEKVEGKILVILVTSAQNSGVYIVNYQVVSTADS
jgi:methionine-rich copper-binding protein CopC